MHTDPLPSRSGAVCTANTLMKIVRIYKTEQSEAVFRKDGDPAGTWQQVHMGAF